MTTCTTSGPDERVYIGGYMYEGIAAFDPETMDFESYPRGHLGHFEGMFTHEDNLYIGSYTRANLFRFTPESDWDSDRGAEQNPYRLAALGDDHQDRPYGWTAVGHHVIAGTVPTYGVLGGLLVSYDSRTHDVETYADVVPGHSIVSLTSRGSTVYGGTSIYGGLGAIPTSDEGVVFAWDFESKEVLWQASLGDDVAAVTSVQVGPDRRLWAVDVGKLYEFDPQTGEVLRDVRLIAYNWTGSSIWKSADIKFGPDDSMPVTGFSGSRLASIMILALVMGGSAVAFARVPPRHEGR